MTTSEISGAVADIVIPGRGLYRSYKFIFTKVARDVQPDSLKYVYEDLFGEPWPEGRAPEDFDLIAAIAWFKSCEIYRLYQSWYDSDEVSATELFDRVDAVVGDQTWAPSLGMLAEGRVF